MDLFSDIVPSEVLSTIFYTFLAFGLFGACFRILEMFTHFSIRKEIVDEHNNAMAVLIGLIAIAMAILVASVIRS